MSTTSMTDGSWFPHERLDVYRVAVQFESVARTIADELESGSPLIDQLLRAAISIPLNIAEGAGEFRPREKARFYRMALRSAAECAAILDLGECELQPVAASLERARAMLRRVGGMLTKLVISQ